MEIDISGYRERYADAQVQLMLEALGCVAIEGPKWCGKTWTALHHASSSIMLGDPSGDFANRRLAELDASLVLSGDVPRLIDEWQEVPAIWDAVRSEVDLRGPRGQFLLTGSATPQRKGILHSGTGRIGKLRMRPMSLYESGDSSGEVSLGSLLRGEADSHVTGEVSLKHLIYLIVRGGWPGNIDVSEHAAGIAAREYVKIALDEDLRKLDEAVNATKVGQLMRSLARNEGTTASKARLRKDIDEVEGTSIDDETVTKYLDILGRMFITDDQPPFSPNIRSSVRVKQQPKRHLADPSLACALLGATEEMLLLDLTTLGFLFESLVERDLRIYAEASGGALYHYQDYRGGEIDAVVEMPDGSWGAFEIKLGANQIDAAAAGLVALRDAIQKEGGRPPKALCVVCGLTNAAYRRPDGVYVVPPTALKA